MAKQERIILSKDQQEIVQFMTSRSTAICSAQTGLGKTIASLVSIWVLLQKFPTLHAVVCCPHKALKAYKKEAKRLNIKINVFSSEEQTINQRYRIDVVTHTYYEKYIRRLYNLHKNHRLLMYIDEIHNYQNRNSKMYNVMLQTRPIYSMFYGQTASPLKNDPMGFFWMCYLVNMKVLGQNDLQFKAKYLLTKKVRIYRRGFYQMEDQVIGIAHPDLLQEAIKNFIIFRQKEYNLNFEFLQARPDEEEKSWLKLAGSGELSESQDNRAAWLHDIQRIIDASHPKVPVNRVSSKERLLFITIKQCLDKNHPPIVYVDYYDTIDRIVKILEHNKSQIGFSRILQISGKISKKQREKVEEQIDSKAIVIITEAGTESINLQGNQYCQGSDTILFYDIPFSIKTILQAIGRVTRTDTTHDTQYVKFLELYGTLDTYKRILAQKHIGDIESVFSKQNTLPTEVVSFDKDVQDSMRKALLWCKDGYMNDEQVNRLMQSVVGRK